MMNDSFGKSQLKVRFLELDVLRGIAALAVLICHYTAKINDTTLIHVKCGNILEFPWGGYAPQLFFIISGFVICMTLDSCSRAMDFIVSRFSKLYPVYWVAVLLSFIVINHFSLYPRLLSIDSLLINLSMLQEWFKVDHVDSVYWTLTVELLFYLVIFTVYLLGAIRHIEWLGVVFLCMMVLRKFLISTEVSHIFLISFFDPLLSWGHLFFAGILFYKLKTRGNAWHRYAALGLCMLVQWLVWGQKMPMLTVPVFLFFLIFILFVFNLLSWIKQAPLIYLGTISYSLYLTHLEIGRVIIEWLKFFSVPSWLCFVIPTCIVMLLASLMTFCVERPALYFIRRLYHNFKA
jgi:peptidoglycan/LPS O-acetylase OafA/YrhL